MSERDERTLKYIDQTVAEHLGEFMKYYGRRQWSGSVGMAALMIEWVAEQLERKAEILKKYEPPVVLTDEEYAETEALFA